MKMIEKAKVFAMAGILAIAGVVAVMPRGSVYAVDDGSKASGMGLDQGTQAAQGNGMQTAELPKLVKNIINVILYAVGIVAVVMMILGGFQYITSSGDAAKVTKAKNTILYGIVGLVIAILAYAIVNFVITNIGGSKEEDGDSLILVEDYDTKELLEHVK